MMKGADKLLFKIIKHVKPKKCNSNVAEYYIDYNHIKNLSFVQRFFVQRFTERKNIDKDGFYLRVRYCNDEIISAELTHIDCSLPCVRLDKETTKLLLA